MWRENLRAIMTHRHVNFTVVMVALIDCFLVTANILADFAVIDGKISSLSQPLSDLAYNASFAHAL